jgi:hypothetical protein
MAVVENRSRFVVSVKNNDNSSELVLRAVGRQPEAASSRH